MHCSFQVFKDVVRILLIIYNLTMAEGIDWKKLISMRYASYKVEVEAYLDSLSISSSSEISIERIHEAIKDDCNVDENLKLLYKEAAMGSNKDVKLRMKNRMSNFRRNLM